eukprot:4063135-Ditylum_brightwellii.AAC.1
MKAWNWIVMRSAQMKVCSLARRIVEKWALMIGLSYDLRTVRNLALMMAWDLASKMAFEWDKNLMICEALRWDCYLLLEEKSDV